MFRRNAFLLALPLLAPTAPAQAAGPELRIGYSVLTVPEGAQEFVAVACYAYVFPGDSAPTDVPLATTIRCAVNGEGSSMLTPGAASVATRTTAAAPPLTICYSASATLLTYPVDGPPTTYTIDAAQQCEDT